MEPPKKSPSSPRKDGPLIPGAEPFRGRGAQINPKNRFLRLSRAKDHSEGIDEWEEADPATRYLEETAKNLVNKVESPDIPMLYSMNPYQGCEHGCAYCYARNSHEYWGYSAGIDFERKILVKRNAPELLRRFLDQPSWKSLPISLSGNTDCYQPAEKKYRITRQLLEICEQYRQPLGIITKNAGILRDMDILSRMASRNLVSVLMTITSLDPWLRRTLEPRTSSAEQRLKVIREFSGAGIRSGVMVGPLIPGLNDQELFQVLKAASREGATFSAYTFIRLNGQVALIFKDWLWRNIPERAQKIWNLICEAHGGNPGDSRWGVRMRGEGPIADLINKQFHLYNDRFGLNAGAWEPDCSRFRRPDPQGSLFGDEVP